MRDTVCFSDPLGKQAVGTLLVLSPSMLSSKQTWQKDKVPVSVSSLQTLQMLSSFRSMFTNCSSSSMLPAGGTHTHTEQDLRDLAQPPNYLGKIVTTQTMYYPDNVFQTKQLGLSTARQMCSCIFLGSQLKR